MRRLLLAVIALLAWSHAGAATLQVSGTTRTYQAYLPARMPAPLVIVLHGNTQRGQDMQTRTSWPQVARRERFVAVFPNGLGRGWADMRGADERAHGGPPAGTDDVAFLTALVEHLVRAGVADPHRIYITGVSNGGAMTMTMACQRPDLFAAAASVIMDLSRSMADACRPAQGIPMLLMNGTADPLVAFEGGRGSGRIAVSNLLSAQDTLQFWRRVDGCAVADAGSIGLPDRDPGDHSTVTRIDSRCPAGTGVVLYRVDGGGHRMPGKTSDVRMQRLVDGVLGPQNHDIDGAETIWAFLSHFRRP